MSSTLLTITLRTNRFNEEMMENLFGYNSSGQNKNENEKNLPNLQNQPKFIQIIEPKKAQNLAILLKALNVTTEEVSDAIMEGDSFFLDGKSIRCIMPHFITHKFFINN